MASLNTNLWAVPEGAYLGVYGSGTYADSPGIGITASQIDVNVGGNSLLQLHAVYGPTVFPGGPGENGPATLPLSGGMVMWNHMQMLYGTVEIRAKLTGTNTHPVLWMLGVPAQKTSYFQQPNVTAGLYPNPVNEIDIAEGKPTVHPLTVIEQNVIGDTGGFQINTATVTDYSQNFHVYKIVWTPGSLVWFIDGVQTNSTTTAVPHRPMFLIMDIEAADASSGDVNQANFPQVSQIDYVKAWDQSNNLIFDDEFDGVTSFQNLSQSNLTFIQSNRVGSNTVSSQAVPFTLSTTSNSYLLAYVLGSGVGTTFGITDTLGNTWTPVQSPLVLGTSASQIFQCVNNKTGGGANTVTVTASATVGLLVMTILEYTGQAAGNPVDAVTVYNSGTGTTGTTPPITTNFPSETLVVFGSSGVATTAGAGFTVRQTGNGGNFTLCEDGPEATAGTYTPSFTQSSSGWFAQAVAIKSFASSSTTPNVVGSTQAGATTALTNAGLVVGTTTSAFSSTVPVGNVISSNPAAGSLLAPGSAVNLVISLGPASGTVSGNVVLSGVLVEIVSDHIDSSKNQVLFTTSDSSGNYSFSGLSVGRYYLSAFASGFVYRQRVLVTVDGVNSNTDINLTPSAVNSWNGN